MEQEHDLETAKQNALNDSDGKSHSSEEQLGKRKLNHHLDEAHKMLKIEEKNKITKNLEIQ